MVVKTLLQHWRKREEAVRMATLRWEGLEAHGLLRKALVLAAFWFVAVGLPGLLLIDRVSIWLSIVLVGPWAYLVQLYLWPSFVEWVEKWIRAPSP